MTRDHDTDSCHRSRPDIVQLSLGNWIALTVLAASLLGSVFVAWNSLTTQLARVEERQIGQRRDVDRLYQAIGLTPHHSPQGADR